MGRGQNSLEEKPNRKNITPLSGRKRATDSKDQKSTKAATAVIPRIYLSRTLTQEPQPMVHNGYLGINFKDRAIQSGILLSIPFLKGPLASGFLEVKTVLLRLLDHSSLICQVFS